MLACVDHHIFTCDPWTLLLIVGSAEGCNNPCLEFFDIERFGYIVDASAWQKRHFIVDRRLCTYGDYGCLAISDSDRKVPACWYRRVRPRLEGKPSMDCSLTGSSVHGILQARLLEWVALPFCRESSQFRDWTQVSHIAGKFSTSWATKDIKPTKQQADKLSVHMSNLIFV